MSSVVFKYFSLFSFLTTFSFNVQAESSIPPKIKYPNRYIRFQAGSMGHKPWDHFVAYSTKANFNAAVFNKLLTVTSNFDLKPGILKSWVWNFKEKFYEFKVDTSLDFSKDRKLSAVDVEFSIVKHFISPLQETDKRVFSAIKGVEKLRSGTKFKSGLCEGIRVIDGDKLRIYLKYENPRFLYTLGDIASPVAPIEDFDEDLFTFNKIPRGVGHYKVIWSDSKSSLVRLERKELAKYLKKDLSPLEVDFYNHGKIEENKIDVATGAGAKELINNPVYKVIKGPLAIGIAVLDFNYQTELGFNRNFREAVSLAIDRKKIAELIPFRTAYDELIPDSYLGRTGRQFRFEPSEAKKIVDRYFKNISSPSKPLQALYHGVSGEQKPKTASIIEDQLERIGIFVRFIPDDAVYFNGKYSDAVMASYGSIYSFADPMLAFANYLPGTSSPESTDLTDSESNRLWAEIQAAGSVIKKNTLIKELGNRFFNEYRTLPLGQIFQAYASNFKIKSLHLEESILVLDFTKVEMDLP